MAESCSKRDSVGPTVPEIRPETRFSYRSANSSPVECFWNPPQDRTGSTETAISLEPSSPRRPASTTTRPGPGANFVPSLVTAARPRSGGEARQLPETCFFLRLRPTKKLISLEPAIRSTRASNTGWGNQRGTRLPNGVLVAPSVCALLIFSCSKKAKVARSPDGRPRRVAPRRAAASKPGRLLPPGPGKAEVEAGLRGPRGCGDITFFGVRVRSRPVRVSLKNYYLRNRLAERVPLRPRGCPYPGAESHRVWCRLDTGGLRGRRPRERKCEFSPFSTPKKLFTQKPTVAFTPPSTGGWPRVLAHSCAKRGSI